MSTWVVSFSDCKSLSVDLDLDDIEANCATLLGKGRKNDSQSSSFGFFSPCSSSCSSFDIILLNKQYKKQYI